MIQSAASNRRNLFSLFVLLMNAVLLLCAVALYGRYVSVYQERLREENLGNIANLNRSAATNATAFIQSWGTKLDDIAQYVERNRLTHEQTLDLICDANSSPDREFELIGDNYAGYLARKDASGAYIPVFYQHDAYESLRHAFDDVGDHAYEDVCFAPEFTDSATALKYFAVYKHLTLLDAQAQPHVYTLLLASKSKSVLSVFNVQEGFDGLSTVLMDAAGNYIVSNSDFKSINFFQYLYVYNDLSLDRRSEIQRQVAGSESGELYFKNGVGQDCVFRYTRMVTNDWYCVTCVPLASFRTPVFSVNYSIYALLMLLLMLLLDILWLQRMNRRLRTSMLREKEASNAKTDFLSRMSHDIRTPLNGIIGLTALAKEEMNPPRTAEYLSNIQVSGDFLLGLVNDVLDMSRVEQGRVELHPEPYLQADFCRYIEAVIAPLCREKGLAFLIEAPENEQPVLLDHLRFNQIIFNLLSNAVKYTPEGGTVRLGWACARLPEDRVALDFTVSDNGIGMSEAFQKHMFDSFSQENPSTANTGAGLGLSIVRNLVKLMDGQISVESKRGEGTTFRLHFETAVCEADVDGKAALEPVDLSGRRVLLCEDNRVNTLLAVRLLERWGVLVDTAENGRVGLERFAAAPPWTYDAILMDVMMPEMNGLDATRAIRKLDRPDAAAIPILAMTANAYDTDVQNCLAAGMNAHMGKPISAEQLRALLQRACARKGVQADAVRD